MLRVFVLLLVLWDFSSVFQTYRVLALVSDGILVVLAVLSILLFLWTTCLNVKYNNFVPCKDLKSHVALFYV